MADKIKVGIIRGGTGSHHAISVRKGGDLISHIFENLSEKYKTVDIFIDKNGNWYANGLPVIPADLVHKIDIIWNTSEHPGLSMILDSLVMPSIKKGHFLKVLENNNDALKKHVKEIGVQVPKSILLPLYQKDFDGPRERYAIKKAKEIFEKFPAPWIVKSFTPDSNMGIHLAKTFGELSGAIEDGLAHGKSILVEEFIVGKPLSVHSITGFRGNQPASLREALLAGDVYVFPIIDSIFSSTEKEKMISFTKNLHKHLNIQHYLKSDFVLHPKKGIFLTQICTSPDLREGSHFEQSCKYIGAEMSHIIEHFLEKTLNKKV